MLEISNPLHLSSHSPQGDELQACRDSLVRGEALTGVCSVNYSDEKTWTASTFFATAQLGLRYREAHFV